MDEAGVVQMTTAPPGSAHDESTAWRSAVAPPEASASKVDADAIAAAAARRIRRRRWLQWATTLVVLVVFLVVWHIASAEEWVNPLFISQPDDVLDAGWDYLGSSMAWDDMQVTLHEVAVGYLLSVVVGVVAGLLLGWYVFIGRALDPFVNFIYAAPRVAFVPLFTVWFGIGVNSKVALVMTLALFPILINTVTGVRTVERSLIEVARSFGAGRWQLFRTVVVPSAVPHIAAGARIAVGLSFIGAIVGELYVAQEGIGFRIFRSGQLLQTDLMIACIAIVAFGGVLATALLTAVERRAARWRSS